MVRPIQDDTARIQNTCRAGLNVVSKDVFVEHDKIKARIEINETKVVRNADGSVTARPEKIEYEFETATCVPKLGVMLVGWGGNNGSTVTAILLANKKNIAWSDKDGVQQPNYWGSLVMATTAEIGRDQQTGEIVHFPLFRLAPFVNPNDIVLGGWDISNMNLADAMDRAAVLDPTLKSQLREEMAALVPLPSFYHKDFIAMNQSDRADNVIAGDLWHILETLRANIRDFKAKNSLDKVIVLWTANTERYADIVAGVNDTADNLLASIKKNHTEIAPSTIFACASVLENTAFINGSPQNTFVPGLVELAVARNVFIAGDDFKSGQTKKKKVPTATLR